MKIILGIITYIGFILTSCSTDKNKMLGTDIHLFEDTPLWELANAVDRENIAEIKRLVKKRNVPINYQEPTYGQTILTWAVLIEKYESCKALLSLGADPNLRSSYNNASNGLIEAADKFDKPKFLKLILDNGVNVNDVNLPKNANDSLMTTPLITAAGNSNLEMVKMIVESGANINFKTPVGNTALKTAALMNHVYIVKYLLIDKGANFDYIFSTTDQGEKLYLVDYMRTWPFEIDSKEWRCKMEIVNYLRERGMDYSKVPVPKVILENYPKEFIDKY